MKQRVCAYLDKQLECTGQPIFTPSTKDEIAEGCLRSIVKADPDSLNNFKGKKLVLLGEYDDTKGFELLENPLTEQVLVDCDEVIQRIYGKYEEPKN